MGTLFGTDGIRGIANETLDNALAYRVGLAAAYQLTEMSGRRPLVVVGKDTRISSDMIEAALSAGLWRRRPQCGSSWAWCRRRPWLI